jgi:acyl carrier protein
VLDACSVAIAYSIFAAAECLQWLINTTIFHKSLRRLLTLTVRSSGKGEGEVMAKVRQIVANQLCLEEGQVGPDSNLSTELGADSLDVVELVMALEEGFDIEIPDEAASEISTVQEAVNFIEQTLKSS